MEWGKMMFQFQNRMLPKAFENYFSKPTHQHATRFASSLNFELVRAKSLREGLMLRTIGPKTWMGVPLEIKKINITSCFYKRLSVIFDRAEKSKLYLSMFFFVCVQCVNHSGPVCFEI